MLQSFLCESGALLTSEEQMIHSELLPPPSSVQSARGASGEADLHLKNGLPGCFWFLSASERADTDHRRGLFFLQRLTRETGRSAGWDGAIEILDEEPGVLPAQSAHLLSLGRLEQPGTPGYTHRQAATPGTSTRSGVPSQPACSQTSRLWRGENSVSPPPLLDPVYIQLKLVEGLWKPAGGCCQGKLTFYI